MSGLRRSCGQRIRRDWLAAADVDRRHRAARVRHRTSASPSSYGTQQDRQALLATAIANPVILLFRGLPSGADEGAFIAFLIFPFLAHARRAS